KQVWLRVTISKATFTTVVKTSPRVNYSITQDATPTLTAAPAWQVGGQVTVALPGYSTKDGTLASPGHTYQWLRSGSAISGATQPSYAIAAADYGKTISVRITTSAPGYLSHSSTTSGLSTVQKGVTVGTPTATISTVGGVLSASISDGSLVPATPLPSIKYQ
ncbi:MAG: hypothetical protein ABI632_08180, partial [Pseudolysinimonas sp.]